MPALAALSARRPSSLGMNAQGLQNLHQKNCDGERQSESVCKGERSERAHTANDGGRDEETPGPGLSIDPNYSDGLEWPSCVYWTSLLRLLHVHDSRRPLPLQFSDNVYRRAAILIFVFTLFITPSCIRLEPAGASLKKSKLCQFKRC